MNTPSHKPSALTFQSVHKFRRFVFHNLERKNAQRYHYPRVMLAQPYFTHPRTNKVTLNLAMLTDTTQYVSPLMSLLNQLRSEGHEVTGAFDEAVAMRTALMQAEKDIETIGTLALKARFKRCEE